MMTKPGERGKVKKKKKQSKERRRVKRKKLFTGQMTLGCLFLMVANSLEFYGNISRNNLTFIVCVRKVFFFFFSSSSIRLMSVDSFRKIKIHRECSFFRLRYRWKIGKKKDRCFSGFLVFSRGSAKTRERKFRNDWFIGLKGCSGGERDICAISGLVGNLSCWLVLIRDE